MEAMSYPEDAPLPEIEYRWLFNQNGKEILLTTRGEYPQVDGTLLSVDTYTISKGYEPPIHDFSLERNGQNDTETLLAEEKLILISSYNLDKFDRKSELLLSKWIQKAQNKEYKVVGVTASGLEAVGEWESVLNIPFYFCDETALKTMIRSNPGIMVIHKGVVTQKLHWNDMDLF
jgi:hypothetical protein